MMMARLRGAALAVLMARVDSFAPRPAALHPITRNIATMDQCSSNKSFSEATIIGVHPPMRASRRTSLSMSAPSAAGAGATILSSLHSNNGFILSALLVVSACGIALEKNSTLGKALSVSYFACSRLGRDRPEKRCICNPMLIEHLLAISRRRRSSQC